MKVLALRILFTATALAWLSASALAVPLKWTLSGVTFTDGGSASGSFVYDADTNTDSAVNITTTTGSTVTGSTYAFVCTAPCDGGTGLLNSPIYLVALTVTPSTNLTGLPVLEFHFPALTDAGGTVALTTATSFEDRCSAADCSGLTEPPVRFVSAGSIIAGPLPPSIPAQIPTLSTWALVVLAVLVVGAVAFTRRRQSAR